MGINQYHFLLLLFVNWKNVDNKRRIFLCDYLCNSLKSCEIMGANQLGFVVWYVQYCKICLCSTILLREIMLLSFPNKKEQQFSRFLLDLARKEIKSGCCCCYIISSRTIDDDNILCVCMYAVVVVVCILGCGKVPVARLLLLVIIPSI